MELLEEPEILKKCYKCDHKLFDNLNITYSSSNSSVVLWNKYQIFVYEDFNFENIARMFVPEFQIHQLIITNNYLLCLDKSGNVHISSLKFKNKAQKRVKSSFQPIEQRVLLFKQFQDTVLCLKNECNTYFLCVNKINADFQLKSKSELKYSGRWPLSDPVQDKCILATHKLKEDELCYVIKLFEIKEDVVLYECSLLIISFDRLSIFTCLMNPKASDSDIILVKLYTCPTEICNMEFVSLDSLNIMIGLSIGSIVKLCLQNSIKKPEVVHLNTALYKCLAIQDSVIYLDGRSMWRTENTFSSDIKLKPFFVRHVKDFIIFGDQIVCTTFSNLIYIFPLDEESSYVMPETTEEYCAAENLLNNSEYLYKIIEEVEKNNELTKRINEEGNYITAYSLSKRQDIMDNVIQHSIMVFDNYEDVIKEIPDITLTENMYEYFKPNSVFLLIKLSANALQQMFSNILSNVFNDVKIHITLSTDQKLLKTSSIKIVEAFKKINALIPLDIKNIVLSELCVNINLVSSIPGAFNERQRLWFTLYRKCAILNSEHFIKTYANMQVCLKEEDVSIDDLVYKTSQIQHGHMFKITDLSKHNTNVPEYQMYMQLPDNYIDILKNETNINSLKHLNTQKAAFIRQLYKTEDFLKCNSNITLETGNVKVKLNILSDDFTNPVLRVTSNNIVVAFHIRNLFSNIIYYDNFRSCSPGNTFVRYTLYTTADNLKKEIKKCLVNLSDYEEFQPLAEQFEKLVIGALPI